MIQGLVVRQGKDHKAAPRDYEKFPKSKLKNHIKNKQKNKIQKAHQKPRRSKKTNENNKQILILIQSGSQKNRFVLPFLWCKYFQTPTLFGHYIVDRETLLLYLKHVVFQGASFFEIKELVSISNTFERKIERNTPKLMRQHEFFDLRFFQLFFGFRVYSQILLLLPTESGSRFEIHNDNFTRKIHCRVQRKSI